MATAKKTRTAATKPHFSKDTYKFWFESMLLMRRFEEKAGQLYGQQKIRGTRATSWARSTRRCQIRRWRQTLWIRASSPVVRRSECVARVFDHHVSTAQPIYGHRNVPIVQRCWASCRRKGFRRAWTDWVIRAIRIPEELDTSTMFLTARFWRAVRP